MITPTELEAIEAALKDRCTLQTAKDGLRLVAEVKRLRGVLTKIATEAPDRTYCDWCAAPQITDKHRPYCPTALASEALGTDKE